jgi:hypothetical protein
LIAVDVSVSLHALSVLHSWCSADVTHSVCSAVKLPRLEGMVPVSRLAVSEL